MNKQAVFTHFSKIIDTMLENSLFFETYFQRPYGNCDMFEGSVDDPALPDNISVCFGVSRGCILDENYNYVVKFDTEGDNFYSSLCEREIEIYDNAIKYGLEQYFTQPVFIGIYRKTIQFYDINKIEYHMNWIDYNPNQFDEDFAAVEDDLGPIIPIEIEVPLYAYPRVERYIYTMLSEKESELYQKQANSIDSPLRNRHAQIAMEFVFCYGMEEYEKLSDFMYANYINDLHYGNLGNYHGKLVIFDFAGFHNGEDSDYRYDV